MKFKRFLLVAMLVLALAAPLAACEIVPSELRRDIGYYAGVAAALNYLKEQGR